MWVRVPPGVLLRKLYFEQVELLNMPLPIYNYKKAQTQKAKSVLVACPFLQKIVVESSVRTDYSVPYYNSLKQVQNKAMLFTSIDEVDSFAINNPNFWAFGKSVFARPCPLNPRHGFVDSKLIADHDSLIEMVNSIKKEDRDGELILTLFINEPEYNAVLTSSGLLSIGKGHDGATSGKSSIAIPVKPWSNIPSNLLQLAGLKNDDNIFIEAVFPKNRDGDEIPFQLTQIRGGPSVSPVADFIPKEITVVDVALPDDNLLRWEKIVKSFEPGTVVYGRGHTLASHAAVHCIINNIPFITSFHPTIGQKLTPIESVPIYNTDKFLLAVHTSIKKDYPLNVMLHLSASILHNWAYIRNSEHASWLLGVSATYMCRVLLALCYGEYRHARNQNMFKNLPREDVYENVISPDKFLKYMSRALSIADSFVDKKKFPSPEFGGSRWSRAMRMCIKVWNSIVHIQNTKLNNLSANRLVNNINKTTNLVHNNGWLFDKISTTSILNKISKEPNQTMFELSDYVFDLYQSVNEAAPIKKFKPAKSSK